MEEIEAKSLDEAMNNYVVERIFHQKARNPSKYRERAISLGLQRINITFGFQFPKGPHFKDEAGRARRLYSLTERGKAFPISWVLTSEQVQQILRESYNGVIKMAPLGLAMLNSTASLGLRNLISLILCTEIVLRELILPYSMPETYTTG